MSCGLRASARLDLLGLGSEVLHRCYVTLGQESEEAMTAKLYAMTCGRLVGRLKDMIEGEDGPVTLPIPSYLIEHPNGRALFDTGMHPMCRTDPARRLSER